MTAKLKAVEFPGIIPPIETAIKVHGEGGVRLQIDVAESDLVEFMPAFPFRGKPLMIRLRVRPRKRKAKTKKTKAKKRKGKK